jgi:hypothetical protein
MPIVYLLPKLWGQQNERKEKIQELLVSAEVYGLEYSLINGLWHSPGDKSHHGLGIISFIDHKFVLNKNSPSIC